MGMQHEVTSPRLLLDEKGRLAEPGWARKLYWQYNREAIPVELHSRLREWDYYLVSNEDYGFSISMSYRAGRGVVTCMLMDYNARTCINQTTFTDNAPDMPRGIDGDIHIVTADVDAKLVRRGETQTLDVRYERFGGEETLNVHIDIRVPETDAMVIATPFDEGEECFYYNLKINCMPAEGRVTLGGKAIEFSFGRDMAVTDYGRGIWPHENEWFWGSGSGMLNGVPFGFNLGYGFGNLSAATENMIFYNGRAHKFDGIVFNIPESGFGDPWTIVSSDGRFDMDFVPQFDRESHGNGSDQHQVFGRFTGKAVLDDGTVLELKDFWGFAEDIVNHW